MRETRPQHIDLDPLGVLTQDHRKGYGNHQKQERPPRDAGPSQLSSAARAPPLLQLGPTLLSSDMPQISLPAGASSRPPQ